MPQLNTSKGAARHPEKRKNPNGKKHVITDNNEKLATAYNNFREVTAFPQARRAGDVDSSARTQ